MNVTYDMKTGYVTDQSENDLDTAAAERELYQAEHNLQLLPVSETESETESETTDPHPAVIAAALNHLRRSW